MSKYIDSEAVDERIRKGAKRKRRKRRKQRQITRFAEMDVSNENSPSIRNVTPGECPGSEDGNEDVARMSVDVTAKRKLFQDDDDEESDDSSHAELSASKVDEETDDGSDAELLALIQPSSSAKNDLAFKKNRKIELYYEYLQGGLLMVGALQEDSDESGFFIQVMSAIRKDIEPMQQIDARFGCSLCACPYSDEKKINKFNIFNFNVVIIVKKFCTFLNLKKEYPGDSGERLVLQKLVDFSNTHGYSKAQGGLFDHPNWDQYIIATEYNRTQSPKRKIGDVVLFSEAKQVVNSVLGNAIANSKLWEKYRKFGQLYFSPPYPQNLNDEYGFPLGTPI
jgi:hypothetical protein